jgi:hypothetical protein
MDLTLHGGGQGFESPRLHFVLSPFAGEIQGAHQLNACSSSFAATIVQQRREEHAKVTASGQKLLEEIA